MGKKSAHQPLAMYYRNETIDELNNMLSDSGVKLNNDISETSVKELINQLAVK